MAKVNELTMQTIRQLFSRYEKEMLASNYSTNSKSPRVGYVRRFVDWIDDAYSPADYPGDR